MIENISRLKLYGSLQRQFPQVPISRNLALSSIAVLMVVLHVVGFVADNLFKTQVHFPLQIGLGASIAVFLISRTRHTGLTLALLILTSILVPYLFALVSGSLYPLLVYTITLSVVVFFWSPRRAAVIAILLLLLTLATAIRTQTSVMITLPMVAYLFSVFLIILFHATISQLDQLELAAQATALHASHERIENILAAAENAIYAIDPTTGKPLYASNSFKHVFGTKLNKHLNEVTLEIVHPDDRERVRRQFDAVKQGQDTHFEYRIVKPNGQTRWVLNQIYVIRDDQNQVIRLDGIGSDITRQKKAAADALDLAIQRERANVLRRFIRAASHEFRTPLSIINSSLYLLQKGKPERKAHHNQLITEQVQRIMTLVDSLLLMTQIDELQDKPENSVQLSEMVEHCVLTVEPLSNQKNIQINTKIPEETVFLRGSEKYLTIALDKILENAVQFSPENSCIHLYAAQDENGIVLNVIDEGTGIAPEHIDRVCERFYRADEAHSTAGFGLGLPTAKAIIELHNGSLVIENEPDYGTHVKIYLPQSVVQL